jgi:hypothetical protein
MMIIIRSLIDDSNMLIVQATDIYITKHGQT